MGESTVTARERLVPILAAVIAVLLVAGPSAVVVERRDVPAGSGRVFAGSFEPAVMLAAAAADALPDVELVPRRTAAARAEPLDAAVPPAGLVVARPAPPPAPAPAPASAPPAAPPRARAAPAPPAPSDSARLFAAEFPLQAQARQDLRDPASRRWAVLVGINRYQGRVKDTLGSVADVHVLREVLLRNGWRDDHILVLTDAAATRDGIVRALEWLARVTDQNSQVVFSYSGHMKRRDGRTGLWSTDNGFVWREDLGALVGAIQAGRMWLSLQGCHAGGLASPGLERPGRIVTYSSRAEQKSFEDPAVGHSVQGYYLFVEGFRDGWGDLNRDARTSVQEAYNWAAGRAHIRTARQQSPIVFDGMSGRGFFLDLRD